MVGGELDSATSECKFPNVRKTYWRSATWNSSSSTVSPKLHAFPFKVQIGETCSPCNDGCRVTNIACAHEKSQLTRPNLPLELASTSCSQEKTRITRLRLPLPPLQSSSIEKKNHDEWPSSGLGDTGECATPITPGRRRMKNGFDIKLDLASIQRNNVEPTEIQLKREKFAHFDKQCSRVADYHIYLGSDAVARDREILRANGITHVLNCVGFVCPEYFKHELVYKTLWLQDSPCEDITSLLYDVFDYFEDVRERDGRVFVHCCQGVSRSTSLVIAYLMWRERRSFEDAFQDVKAARGITNPNMGFACQLLQCQKRVHAIPLSPNVMPRFYKLVPHSSYDPLHLVPKSVNNPGVGSLDSRGAFVIHSIHAIVVWIGHCCDHKMAQAAIASAGQIVRYENIHVSVKVFAEGHEDPEFWESLKGNDEHNLKEDQDEVGAWESDCLEDKQKNGFELERIRRLGTRKVSSNDKEYDLYHTARLGGVIPPVPFTCIDFPSTPTHIPMTEDGWSLLRGKFLCGDLLGKAKGIPSNGIVITSVSSPDTSMGSSSPHLSPFSAHSSCESPFSESPTLSEDLTHDTQQSNSQLSLQVRTSEDFPPFFRSSSVTTPRNPSVESIRKSSVSRLASVSSLASRRGSIPPTLLLPSLDEDPPLAPRGTSRKLKLPPLITQGKYNACDDSSNKSDSVGEMEQGQMDNRKLQPSTSSCSKELDSRNGLCENNSDIGNSSALGCSQCIVERTPQGCRQAPLYTWPGFEQIDMYDIDDLDSEAVFVLDATKCFLVGDPGMKIYVWVGKHQKQHEDKKPCDEEEVAWSKIGQDFLHIVELPFNVAIEVVREGEEPEEFWVIFNSFNTVYK